MVANNALMGITTPGLLVLFTMTLYTIKNIDDVRSIPTVVYYFINFFFGFLVRNPKLSSEIVLIFSDFPCQRNMLDIG